MKRILFAAIAATALASCGGSGEKKAEITDKQAATVATGAAYAVDSTSTVEWTGSKPVGKHTGTFKVKDGSLNVGDSGLTGGTFTIDINSLNNIDLASDAENKGKLEGHLKSPDFFDAAKFPAAKFEITSVEKNTDTTKKEYTNIIKGNLTLKDSTKNISFPAKITANAKSVTATADFTIDRTLWGMNYKGPNNPQDWVISKEVGIKLNISATKK